MEAFKFVKKPEEIEAVQFDGWTNAGDIFTWADGRVFYVFRGYDHTLRREAEYDRSNGHCLDDAVGYLVVHTLNGQVRADAQDWIAKDSDGDLVVYSSKTLDDLYDFVDKVKKQS